MLSFGTANKETMAAESHKAATEVERVEGELHERQVESANDTAISDECEKYGCQKGRARWSPDDLIFSAAGSGRCKIRYSGASSKGCHAA